MCINWLTYLIHILLRIVRFVYGTGFVLCVDYIEIRCTSLLYMYMKHLKIYEDFNFDEEDFDYEEESIYNTEELRNNVILFNKVTPNQTINCTFVNFFPIKILYFLHQHQSHLNI